MGSNPFLEAVQTSLEAQEAIMKLRTLFIAAVVLSLAVAPIAYASHAADGVDVKVTNDNNNVDGGTPNPGFDSQNRQSNETTVSINPANPNIIAVGANDYHMGTVTGDVW